MDKDIATASKTKEILLKYNLNAKKGFGQNFIIDPNIVRKIASLSKASDKTTVIEIGPGIGALTQQLAYLSKKVIAFEIDDDLIPVLEDSLSDLSNVTIVHQDFLQVDLKDYVSMDEDVIVCANLPYYITTPILFKLFESDFLVNNITVMMQKEVADRFAAKANDPDYNALSVITSYLYDSKIVMKIPKEIFNPRPRIDSAVIQFIRKNNNLVDNQMMFFEFVKGCFKQRRKTLYNNLREFYEDKVKAEDVISNCGFDLNIRAQQLSLNDFVTLYNRGLYEK
ncbi:MAG: 16S rRNA (adenine(1518)-N(6)/adenine(1519)-N(6))-dimethyltransferase RsmA [Erysipelotrichaceae bacterium]